MLPLDDPRWNDLRTDGYPIARILDGLAGILKGAPFGVGRSAPKDAFDFTAGTLHQGTIYSSAFAVIPYVVEVAARRSVDAANAEVWTWLGILASAHRRSEERARTHGVPEYLVADYRDALERAERAAVACLLATRLRPQGASYLALAAVALAGHRAGRFLWSMPEEPTSPLALFARVLCPECEAETELIRLPDGVAALEDMKNPPRVADATQPAPALPALHDSLAPRVTDAWAAAASALGSDPAGFPRGAGDVARRLARSGVPRGASEQAVLCLVAALIAIRGHEERARAFMRLASNVRCPECGVTSSFVECVGA